MPSADIGLIGLAVMGSNLALNIAEKGYTVAVHNRTASKIDDFVVTAREQGLDSRIVPEANIASFIKAVKRSIELAAVNPEFYPFRFDKVRRIMVKKFPYAVYYEQDEPIIYIHSVFHESRNPSHLDRLRNL